ERLRKVSQTYLVANRHTIAVSSSLIPVIRMAILGGFICTLVLGGFMVMDGRLNVGLYGVLIFLTQRLLWPLTRLVKTIDLFKHAKAYTRRILKLLEVPIGNVDPQSEHDFTDVKGDLPLKEASYHYTSNETLVLRHITFEIEAGQ